MAESPQSKHGTPVLGHGGDLFLQVTTLTEEILTVRLLCSRHSLRPALESRGHRLSWWSEGSRDSSPQLLGRVRVPGAGEMSLGEPRAVGRYTEYSGPCPGIWPKRFKA